MTIKNQWKAVFKQQVKIIMFKTSSTQLSELLDDVSRVSKTLKDIETILYPSHFFRIHASYLINLHFIKRILKSQSCTVELSNNTKLEMSRSRREDLLLKMETL